MKKQLLSLSVFLLTLVPQLLAAREWMVDAKFRRGLALSPLSPLIVQQGGGFAKTNTDTLCFSSTSHSPQWQVAQWWSRHDLAHTPCRSSQWGRCFANEGKSIALHHGILTLEIKTSKEYTRSRQANDQWPHLLIQQDFARPIRLTEQGSLVLSYKLQLLYCHNRMRAGEYSPSLHTAQSPFYLYLRNVNPASREHGKSLWLGAPSFDYRDKALADTSVVSWDIGTSMYIYQMPPRELWGNILFTDHRWHHLKVDIIPQLRNALRRLRELGLFQDSRLEDFVITGMNFGWEVPGTFDAALRVRDFSLCSEP